MTQRRHILFLIITFTYAVFIHPIGVFATPLVDIDLEKYASIHDENNWAEEITLQGPGLVDFRYEITNVGSEILSNISLSDDKLGQLGSLPTLISGQMEFFVKSAFLSETTVNIGYVSAVDQAGITISAEDVATVNIDPVPEPTTMLLLGTGLVGVAGAARRKKKNQA